MITFVKSTAFNSDRRDIIRRTWGSVKCLDGAQFHTIFVIGKSPEATQVSIIQESKKYGDILQIDVSDKYK